MARLSTLPSLVGALPARIAAPPKHLDEFYRSHAWLNLMRRIKAERGSRCEGCGAMGVRILGDHIRERKDGGAPLDARNVKLLCMGCHGIKTAKARGKRARGQVYAE